MSTPGSAQGPVRAPGMARLVVWRHPRPAARRLAGRCIGQHDLPADPRKARRLARRIVAWVRRHDWPGRTIWTSPLARGAVVGRLLRRRGWRHRIDPLLAEVDFGRWDGLAWSAIPVAEIDAWRRDLQGHRPGGGESAGALAARVRAFCLERSGHDGDSLVVGHGGWVRLAQALVRDETPDAGNWGRHVLAHGQRLELDLQAVAHAAPGWLAARGGSGRTTDGN